LVKDVSPVVVVVIIITDQPFPRRMLLRNQMQLHIGVSL